MIQRKGVELIVWLSSRTGGQGTCKGIKLIEMIETTKQRLVLASAIQFMYNSPAIDKINPNTELHETPYGMAIWKYM